MFKFLGSLVVASGLAVGQTQVAGVAPSGVVAGAPYSAEAVMETSNGSGAADKTPSKTVLHVYRDGQGRTRTEQLAADGADVTSVEVTDPVAGVRYVLDAQNRLARKQTLGSAPGGAIASAGVPNVVPPPPPGGLVLPEGVAAPNFGPGKVEVTDEKLGTQTIEGLEAEGTRHTITIPAGEQGNSQPVVISSEAWYSPELKMNVLSKESNPMTGERTTKLTNVSRGEPAASLFQPPADYAIVEMGVAPASQPTR